MGKILKYLLWIIFALILLLVIGIGILFFTVNPNDLKGPITKQVDKATGRNLTIDGDISWKFFPWLGLSIQDVKLSNPQGFTQKQPFLSLKDADVSVKLLPLLTGKIQLGAITVDGLRVNLITNENGKNNWENLKQENDKTTKKVPTTVSKNKKTNEELDLSISSVNIDDASVNYKNEEKKQQYQLSDFDLNSKNINLNSSFPIDMSFEFKSSKPQINGEADIDAKISMNQAAEQFAISPLVVNAKVFGLDFPKNGLVINLKTNFNFDQKQATLALKNLSGKIANMAFSGTVDGINLFKKPTFNGDLALASFNPKTFMKDLGLTAPNFTDKNAFEKLSLNSNFIVTPTAISIQKLQLNLDDSRLSGNAYLTLASGEQSQFNLQLNQIDVADYMLKHSNQTTKKNNGNGKSKNQTVVNNQNQTKTNGLLPIDALRKLNLKGSFSIGKLHYDKLTASDIKLNILADDGIIRMHNNSAKLYQGQWLSNIALNVQAAEPILQINEAINHVQIAPLVEAFSDNQKLQISGEANLKANLTSKGNSTTTLTKNLNGSGRFSMLNGEIKGVDIGFQLDRALALVNKKAPPKQSKKDVTPFASLTGSVTIKNGVVKNDDLLLKSPLLTVTGKGYANLVNQQLNYELEVTANEKGVPAQVYALQQKIGGSIPIEMSGTFANYKVYPNIDVILENLATSYVKQNAGKIKDKVNKNIENLGKQLQKGLQNIFN